MSKPKLSRVVSSLFVLVAPLGLLACAGDSSEAALFGAQAGTAGQPGAGSSGKPSAGSSQGGAGAGGAGTAGKTSAGSAGAAQGASAGATQAGQAGAAQAGAGQAGTAQGGAAQGGKAGGAQAGAAQGGQAGTGQAGATQGGKAGAAQAGAAQGGSAGAGQAGSVQMTTCSTGADCPGEDTACRTRVCLNGGCGVSVPLKGTLLPGQTSGDCTKLICNGMGDVVAASDLGDVPDDGNPCTNDTCDPGPTHTNTAKGDACGSGKMCDGNGQCGACIDASTCPGSDDECKHRTCTSGVCGVAFTQANTLLLGQVAGDCVSLACNGKGGVVALPFDDDAPDDGNACTANACSSGVPSNPALPAGTPCKSSGGSTCDGKGKCGGETIVALLRVGDGSGLSSASAPVFIEYRRLLDGALATMPFANPLPAPTVASGSQNPVTLGGTSSLEGNLAVSATGGYLTFAGYAAAPGAALISSTQAGAAGVPRVVARVDQAGNFDTSTTLGNAFAGSSVRSAVTADGSAFWVTGNASNAALGGVQYAKRGAALATQVVALPNNARFDAIVSGKLLFTSATTTSTVYTVDQGLPTAGGATATALFTQINTSPAGFFALDLDGVPGIDRVYVADERSLAAGGGIQKWVLSGGVWSLAVTITTGLPTGVRGLSAMASGGKVTLMMTGASGAGNAVFTLVDDDVNPSPATVFAAAPQDTVFRGVTFLR